jgi:hypothetical protein
MIPIMVPPRSSSAAPVVPEQLQPLVKQLAALSEGDRDLVIRAANSQAEPRKRRTMSWETIERATGIVSLGGNADDDCKALYDG